MGERKQRKEMKTLTDMIEGGIELAHLMRENGQEVGATLFVKHDGKVDIIDIRPLTENKDILSAFIKRVGAQPSTDAIVFMSEAWMTEIDKVTRQHKERKEILSITGETIGGEVKSVTAPIIDGKIGEAIWTDVSEGMEYQGRISHFFSERKKSDEDGEDWRHYIQ